MKTLHIKLGLSHHIKVVRKAQELLRLSNVHFNSSSFGVVSLLTCLPALVPTFYLLFLDICLLGL